MATIFKCHAINGEKTLSLFEQISEKLSSKCLYVVSLTNYPKGEISRPDTITKGGYTEDDLEYRISKFNFSGKLKGHEEPLKPNLHKQEWPYFPLNFYYAIRR